MQFTVQNCRFKMFGSTTIIFSFTALLIKFANSVPLEEKNYHNIPDELHKFKSGLRYKYDQSENSEEFWLNKGKHILEEKIKTKVQKGIAKNIIFFLGDGMSIPTLAASRVYLGHQSKKPGEETVLSFEEFPYSGLSKTYCVNSQVADSACTATAYLGGIKGNIKTIGVTGDVKFMDCSAMNNKDNWVDSIAVWAQVAGKDTGIVTTSRVTHASPAGTFAHTAHRDWECDADVIADNRDPKTCFDTARQLVEQSPGKNFKVILGGGRNKFLTVNDVDPEYTNATGSRVDKRNLVKKWLEHKKNIGSNASYVWNKEDMLKAVGSEYILGLFEPSHMLYHLEANPKTEPTLEEMTEVAIKSLSRGTKGYFLFVEGAKIDMAHHESWPKMAFDETVEFAKAVTKAVEMTNVEDTLIVVTSDHAHTMSFSGYPARGSDILTTLQTSGIDGLPYSTISYANGPGYKTNDTDPWSRYNLNVDKDRLNGTYYRFQATVPILFETHGGDDVAVFARGPWSHLLTGSYEQIYIPYVLGYASRIGPTGNISIESSSSITTEHSISVLIGCTFIALSRFQTLF